jgi:hypothetical protein
VGHRPDTRSEVSLDLNLLEDVQVNPNHTEFPWTREEVLTLMLQRNLFTVIVMEPIFVHGDFYSVARTGLFGLQLVHADDHVRLSAYFGAGETGGAEIKL